MPNQCVHCSKIYDDASEDVLKGCSGCGSRFFFYMSKEKLNKIEEDKEEIGPQLTGSEKKQIESDVREIVGAEDEDSPIILDFETVKIIKPGKYILDIANLFSNERPLIYKLEDGKYIIDLAAQIKSIKRSM